MTDTPLVSHMRALCESFDIKWDWDMSDVQLARAMIDENPTLWESFRNQAKIAFDYEMGVFYDIEEIAFALMLADESDNAAFRRKAQKVRDLLSEHGDDR